MQDTQKIVNFVTTSNWILLLFGGMIGLMMTPMKFALGIILGGLIVAINFHLLKNTLKNMFRPEVVSEQGRSLVGNVLVKYYIRFAISGMLIFLLISKHIVHPLGLLAGLSVVVASMFMATALELTRLFFKEAV
ncbi:MAG: ATP synthase subunit I [Deltaproteobacteria bacterium]|nr:ATP synthase subunit I [Deltaproteobacteria bacterium]